MGMVEDSIEAIHALEHVKLRFFLSTTNHSLFEPRFFGSRFQTKIAIPLPPTIFARLPQKIKDGLEIKVVPVFFNVGVDHRASLARVFTLSLFSGLQVENELNYENFDKLKAYIDRSVDYLSSDVPELMELLRRTIYTNKAKNVDIFPLTEKICRLASGIRVTGCKSAKDRTSMGFTLEQGQLLIDHHDANRHDLQEILNQFRRYGTSIENVYSNTNVKAYAFSYIQLLTFPEFYRPQQGTYAESPT